MARQYVVSTGTVPLVASTAKTILELPTGATMPLKIYAWEIGFSNTAAGSCTLQWATYTGTGTGTVVIPLKIGDDQSAAAITGSVKVNNTVEPTGVAVGGLPGLIVPLPGMYSIIYSFDREMFWPVSTLRCFRATISGNGNAFANFWFEQ